MKAGMIAAEALKYGKGLIKIGASLLDVTEKIEETIANLGGRCAFPINISINHIAAHYSSFPDDKTIFQKGNVVKLDIGVHVNGHIADNAATIDLGDNKELILAAEKALKEAIVVAKPGIKIN